MYTLMSKHYVASVEPIKHRKHVHLGGTAVDGLQVIHPLSLSTEKNCWISRKKKTLNNHGSMYNQFLGGWVRRDMFLSVPLALTDFAKFSKQFYIQFSSLYNLFHVQMEMCKITTFCRFMQYLVVWFPTAVSRNSCILLV